MNREEKLTTKWLRENAPGTTSLNGMIIPIDRRSLGKWNLTLGSLRNGGRTVEINSHRSDIWCYLPIGTVSSVGELIDLYERLSGKPWPQPAVGGEE